MYLKQLQKDYFNKDTKYTFLFPIGATEQHGPFLPYGTDTYITDYVVHAVEAAFPDIIVLPTLEVSRSGEHRGFFGTLWLTPDTLTRVMHDICASIAAQAKVIYITSFHANDAVIDAFIAEHTFDCSIVHLDMIHPDDDAYIETLLDGPMDGHAGNTEISNMLAIDETLITLPDSTYPKQVITDAWETDNLIEKSVDGIVDNHPEWKVDSVVGQQILEIYAARAITNVKNTR